ncbi:hypothetical protein CDAR_24551 [Caerostris darwini]|uniref:Uncharacterized protein n=1 Tax=Caerostris darwini TaxID=1538125 RepID=A0AAV4SCR5_9ARAC|nr:hypothetical protein CDAR_24551 [Caerostris darwini]
MQISDDRMGRRKHHFKFEPFLLLAPDSINFLEWVNSEHNSNSTGANQRSAPVCSRGWKRLPFNVDQSFGMQISNDRMGRKKHHFKFEPFLLLAEDSINFLEWTSQTNTLLGYAHNLITSPKTFAEHNGNSTEGSKAPIRDGLRCVPEGGSAFHSMLISRLACKFQTIAWEEGSFTLNSNRFFY